MPEENSPITAPGATWCSPEFQPWVIDSTETAARLAFERCITQEDDDGGGGDPNASLRDWKALDRKLDQALERAAQLCGTLARLRAKTRARIESLELPL
jgi:hypothetical protein